MCPMCSPKMSRRSLVDVLCWPVVGSWRVWGDVGFSEVLKMFLWACLGLLDSWVMKAALPVAVAVCLLFVRILRRVGRGSSRDILIAAKREAWSEASLIWVRVLGWLWHVSRRVEWAVR